MQGYKYPRRLRTGRPLATAKGDPPDLKKETNPPSGDMWVPQDVDFDETKAVRTRASPQVDAGASRVDAMLLESAVAFHGDSGFAVEAWSGCTCISFMPCGLD